MKCFQPKAGDTPPDDDQANPPAPDTPAEDHPESAEAKIDPMLRPTCQNRNAEVNFRGEKRSNASHAATTDPDARLFKTSPARARCSAPSGMPSWRTARGGSGRVISPRLTVTPNGAPHWT